VTNKNAVWGSPRRFFVALLCVLNYIVKAKNANTLNAFVWGSLCFISLLGCSQFTDSYLDSGPTRNILPDSLFVINDDADRTYAVASTLTVNMKDVQEMRFRNESGTWTEWRPFSLTLPWDLMRSTGNRAVMGEFRDSRGRIHQSEDTILFIERISHITGAQGECFGWALASSGDGATLAAGTRLSGRGRAFVYQWTPAGWNEIELIASDGASGDSFGYSVSITSDGTTVAVGARDRDEAQAGQGAVYIFSRDLGGTNVWGQLKKLTTTDDAVYARFGQSLALSSDGSTLVVGASGQMVGANAEQGLVHVFQKDHGGANNWGLLATLVANNGDYQDQFGHSVAVSTNGTIIAAGAPWHNGRRGACYVFRYSGGYSQSQLISDANGADNDYMGQSVSISSDGGSLIVGADGYDQDLVTNSGCVLVYTQNAGNYEYRSRLTVASPHANDRFGYSMRLSSNANHLAIGAHLSDVGGVENAGAVFLYQKSGLDFVLTKTLSAPDAEAAQMFGNDIAMSSDGGIVFAASYMDDIQAALDDRGSVYVFRD